MQASGRHHRILLVSHVTPPSASTAAPRPGGFAKYLSRLGHHVTVLTSKAFGSGPVPEVAHTVRTRDLLATELNWRRANLAGATGGAAAYVAKPSALDQVVVPDVALPTWIPFALPRAIELHRREPFDCVITSSPPESTHLIGLALDVPWIIDLHDGWTFESPREQRPTAAQRAADEFLEAAVVRGSDAAIAVSRPIVDDLRARFDADAHVITNGFDPDDLPPGDTSPHVDPERLTLVHTGRMAAARATPAPLLEALRLIRAEGGDVAERLEVLFAGPATDEERELIEAPDLRGTTRYLGALDRPDALQLQRAADGLLVVTMGALRSSIVTTKLFEYLGARRPVLVLGEGVAAAEIVRDAGAGFATSNEDPAQIAAAIRRLLEERPTPTAEAVAAYGYPVLAERLSELVDSVVQRNARSTPAQ